MKKSLFILGAVLYLLTNLVMAQTTFQKAYGTTGNEYMGATIKTSDGGFIMTGSTPVGNYPSVYAVKTDSNGVQIWSKIYGKGEAYHINSASDGGYIITGITHDSISGNAMLLKIKADGTLQWAKGYGLNAEEGRHVEQTKDKGYIVAGRTFSNSSSGHVYVFKTDSLGNMQWNKRISGGGCCGYGDMGISVIQTNDSCYVLLANVYYNIASRGIVYLAKIAPADSVLWERCFLNPSNTNFSAYSLTQTLDKGFIIAGTNCLFKTDSAANLLWSKEYTNTSCLSVIETTGGGYAFRGYDSTNHITLVKTALNGSVQWSRAFSDTTGYYFYDANSLMQTTKGQYVLSSLTTVFGAGQGDLYLIKADSTGNSNCQDNSISVGTNTLSLLPYGSVTKDTLGHANSVTVQTSTGATIENILCYQTAGIHKFADKEFIHVYPNPAVNFISIRSSVTLGTIVIYNIMGETVMRISNADEMTKIDVSSLSNGVYFLKNQHSLVKFIKQ